MSALADRSLAQFLDDVAARTPAPGGGSSCGVACALAAGLVEMAAGFTADDDRVGQVRARAGELRAQALALAERELHTYGAVLEARRLPADAPGRAERIDAAVSDATDTPLAIARAAAEVAELAAEIGRTGNPHLRGDAVTGALLANAACQAAANLVALNLGDRPDDARREEAGEVSRRSEMAALSAVRDV